MPKKLWRIPLGFRCGLQILILVFMIISCSFHEMEEVNIDEADIEEYMTRYWEAVEHYAESVSYLYTLFYNETGLDETQFDLLRSSGNLPVWIKEPNFGSSLPAYYSRVQLFFYQRRFDIMVDFLKDKGLFGLFTWDYAPQAKTHPLHLLYKGESFLYVHTDEDFRTALLLMLSYQARERSL